MVINWPGLNDKEKTELIPTLSTTDNWILLTHPQGASTLVICGVENAF